MVTQSIVAHNRVIRITVVSTDPLIRVHKVSYSLRFMLYGIPFVPGMRYA
jgi:hypothetical protein